VVTEARGNCHTVDIIETNGPELESMSREKIPQAIVAHLAHLGFRGLRPHGECRHG
jgi:iron(III) transport system substrate-binding protein